MRFTYIKISPDHLPGIRIIKGDDDNLATLNMGLELPDAYFTCGDLVLNYNRGSGKVVSFDGYLPYFDTLPAKDGLVLPGEGIPSQLSVGDLSGNSIFSIDDLPLELSGDKTVLHAGNNKAAQILKLADSAYIGLRDERITDIYLRLG